MKTALVTGAGRGIGRATAEALAKSGLQVFALDKDSSPPITGTQPIQFDLTDLAGIPALVSGIGRLDVLVNNAGIQAALPIDRYTDEARGRMLRINLEAPVELIRAASKGMAERGSGRIVNVASVAAYMAHTDLWYGVTKAGVVSFTRSFASEVTRVTDTVPSHISPTRSSIRLLYEPSPAIACVTSARSPGLSPVITSSSIA